MGIRFPQFFETNSVLPKSSGCPSPCRNGGGWQDFPTARSCDDFAYLVFDLIVPGPAATKSGVIKKPEKKSRSLTTLGTWPKARCGPSCAKQPWTLILFSEPEGCAVDSTGARKAQARATL